jgi:6,7-dimethyl-8-ribityllumazine synthase
MPTPPPPDRDGSALRIATVVARFNEHITARLLDGAEAVARECGVGTHDVSWVPGSFELPVAALRLAKSGRYDAVVCLGAVVRHETDHYTYVAGGAATGIQQVSLQTGVPCLFGVITCDTEEQAMARCRTDGKGRNIGSEAMTAAIETANLLRGMG